jgi:hypothetical protein
MTGQFFALEQNAWARVCKLGLYPAVAYLLLAQGSQKDNRHSNWSANAIENHTGISRPRARRTLELLEEHGLIQMTRPKPRPVYDLLPGYPDTRNLTETQRAFLRAVAVGRPAPTPAADDLDALATQGLIRVLENGAIDAAPGAVPDWIWLPNALVTGAADETPPVERLRQSRDLQALRLLIALYDEQNLAEYGGLPLDVLSGPYDRAELGTQGAYTVYGFSRQAPSLQDSAFIEAQLETVFRDETEPMCALKQRFERLYNLGLLESTPILLDSSDADAEPLHPIDHRSDDPLLRDVAETAGAAGTAMLTEPQRARALMHHMTVVPVERHIPDVQLADVFRLRYRPHTRLTAAWWASTRQRSQDALAHYTRLRDRALDMRDAL